MTSVNATQSSSSSMPTSSSTSVPSSLSSPSRRAATVEDGERQALRCVGTLLTASMECGQPELEALCRLAFTTGINTNASSASNSKTLGSSAGIPARERERLRLPSPYIPQYNVILARHDAAKHGQKQKSERKVLDLLPTGALSALSASPNQVKNQAFRFGLEEGPTGMLQRQTWAFTGAVSGAKNLFSGGGASAVESRDYEEVINPKILMAPISEICIVQRGEPVPDGFYRLSRSPGNLKANINSGSGGNHIFLCIKKDLTGEAVPITTLCVIFPDKNESVPPGFFCVRRGKHACNLNTGTSAERIFLCYKKDKCGNPLVDVQIFFPGKNEECPKGFSLIEKSPTGIPINLNTGTGGGRIFICYRHRLTRLECLSIDENVHVEAVYSPQRHHRKLSVGGGGGGGSGNGNASLNGGSVAGDNGKSISKHNGNDNSAHHSPLKKATSVASVVGASATNSKLPGSAVASSVSSTLSSSSSHPSNSNRSVPPVAAPSSTASMSANKDSLDDGEEEVEASDRLSDVHEDMSDGVGDDQGMVDDDFTYAERGSQPVVDVDGNLAPLIFRRALHPLLASLYVRHGNVAQIALIGLGALLKDSDFFESDLRGLPMTGTITMLDMTVEAVCDRFDNCLESECESILQFIRILIKHSSGKLSAFILQQLFKSLSFLSSYYSTRNAWIVNGHPMPCDLETGGDVPGFRMMRELIWAIVAQAETVDVARTLPDILVDDYDYSRSTEAFFVSRSLAVEIIEEVIDSVEVSRISEATHLIISKQSSSTASSAFWLQTNALARRLFVEPSLRSAFVALCAVCKLAWHGIRTSSGGEPTPRDLGSKLLALESVLEFCSSAGEKLRSSKVMGYQIRRLVIPCLLNNLPHALVDNRLFSKVLRIISSIWKCWRCHCRIEFANLSEQLVIKILQAPTLKVRPIFQMTVLQEVVTWFDQPHLLVEMFVNFDMDSQFVSHWNVFSHLVRAVCTIARRTSVITGAWDWRPGGSLPADEGSNKKVVTVRMVHMQALEEVSHIAKTLMDATGHAYLIMQDAKFRSRSLGAGAGWEEDIKDACSSKSGTTTTTTAASSDGQAITEDSMGTQTVNDGQSPLTQKKLGNKFRRHAHQQSEEMIKEAVKIYHEKESLKKAIDYLVLNGFMANTPQEIASFLRVYKNSFDPSAIGDFLGEGGRNKSEEEYWKQIRFRYTRAVSFVELEVEAALRLYLTGCGFRLPGEGQKVDRFVEVFVKAFWQDNSGTVYCPFKHPDTVHLLAYACIMLNTDLHRANDPKKQKKIKKMVKEDFLKQLRGADQGNDIDPEYLGRIYDNIASQPIVLAVEASEAGATTETNSTSTSGLVGGKPATTESISVIEEKAFVKEVSRSIRDSEDLLRSLSPFTFHFQVTGIDTNISLDLVSFMYECVWFHFHAITESLLVPESGPTSDIYVIFAALDILCYSLTSAIFLDLKTERAALASQLSTFKRMCEAPTGIIGKVVEDNSWLTLVENTTMETAMETIAEVHKLMVKLKDCIQESANHEITRAVAARIEKRAKVLDVNTFFVREGDLLKRNNNGGRLVSYRFFLFSEQLIYAHESLSGEYKVHGQLSLSSMCVSDVNDPTGCSFYIEHPTKSFLCVCESPTQKDEWLRDINLTISGCKKRAATQAARKMSIVSRLEDQQEQISRASRAVVSPPRHKEAKSPRDDNTSEQLPPPPPSISSSSDSTITPNSSDLPTSTNGQMISSRSPFTSVDSSGNLANSDTSSPPSPPSNTNTTNTTNATNATNATTSNSTASPTSTASTTNITAPSPTPEQRAATREDNIRHFNEIIAGLGEKNLSALFAAGLILWKGMLDSRGSAVSEENKMKMYGLYKQSKSGPWDSTAPAPADPVAMKQAAAWKECGNMTQDDAKRSFLRNLYSLAPYWKYQQFI